MGAVRGHSTVFKSLLVNQEGVGLNPTTEKKWTLRGHLHRRCPSGQVGSQRKTSHVKAGNVCLISN